MGRLAVSSHARRPVRAAGYPLAMGLALAMMVSASAAPAAPPMEGRGSAERGAFLVQRWCTGCHVAGGQGTDAVPSLATLARAQSAAALRTFLVKPHGGMPDPGLETQGIEDVIAYMETLR